MNFASSARRVLVIGGTGYLGRRITEQFVSLGDRVAVLTRGQRPLEGLDEVEPITADRNYPDSLKDTLGSRTFDVVVDNVAFNENDVSTLLTVLAERVGHYLLTSSSAAYASTHVRRPLRETDADLALRLPVDAPNAFHPRLGQAYGNGKRAAESALRGINVPWTVMRPPIIVGPDDRTLRIWWLAQRLMDGAPILLPEWGAGRMFQVVWVNDVARAFGVAAANPEAFGQTYNLAQAEIFTAETWVEAAAAQLGKQVECVRVPESELPALGLEGYAMPIAGRSLGHILLDLGAARLQLGFDPAPEPTWLGDTIRGCAAQPPSQISAGYERREREVAVAQRLMAQRQNGSWMLSETRA